MRFPCRLTAKFKENEMRKGNLIASCALAVTVFSGAALAQDTAADRQADQRRAERAERIERPDRPDRGDRVERRLDRHGDITDRRLDRRGRQFDRRFDRRQDRRN
jgi:hypothetical protein